MKPYHLGLLLLLAAIWGASYLFIRVASPVIGPFVLMEARVLIALLILGGYSLLQHQTLDLAAHWRRYLALGTVSGALPFSFIAVAELYMPASLASILNATTPLFTAIVAALWLKEALTVRRILGLILGMIGVGALVGWSPVPITGSLIFGVCVSLIAAASYGFGGVYASRAFHGVPPLALATGQQLGASVVLLPFALIALPRAHFTVPAVANLLGLAVLSTGFAYLIYYPLLKEVGPTRTLSVTFLIPGFGLLWGALFLHEKIDAGTIAGLLVILASIFLITGLRVRRRPVPSSSVPAASAPRS